MLAPAISSLIAALPQPVLLVDADGIIEAANPPATELFGSRLAGAPIRAHLRQPDVAAMLERVFGGQGEDSARFVMQAGSAETVWRVVARAGPAGLIVLSLCDISDLESAETQRRDFVANVSHELRSPLTVLTGFVETLQGPAGDDPETRGEFLGIMAEQARRMSGLVDDLLSLSRVETVEKIRPRSKVSIKAVLGETVTALRPRMDEAGLRVDCDIPDDLPDIPGDHDQLLQVFHNLIENGVNYGAAGGRLEIGARRQAEMPGFDGAVTRVSVRDFGQGIDPIYIPRLTERFYRVDKARSRDSGGTGLGLAIVKHILNRHRGRLNIRAAPGEGACFEAILPCD